MMADEYFDSDQNNSQSSQRQHTKLEAMFPPSNNLSNKPAASSDASQFKQQLASAEQGGENTPSDGYYQNVKTKSKLILPTAIWVLIIVGGLCFLSLLASLNRTLGTLDTLIEIEQKNHGQRKGTNEEKSNDKISNEVNSKEAFKDSRLLPVADRLKTSDSDDFLRSWFSFPSWASLEPFPMIHNNHKQIFSEISDQNREQPFIHANIDKLNININTPNNQDDQQVKRIPLSPLSELILPPQSLSDRLDFNSPPMSLEGNNVRPSMFMRPPPQSQDLHDHLIITLEGNNNGPDRERAPLPLNPSPPLNTPLREIHNHHLGPQPNSPYELLVANGPQRPNIEDDLAESVAQSLFKVLEASDPGFAKPDFPREQSAGLMQPSHPPPPPPPAPLSHSHLRSHSHSQPISGPKPANFPAPRPESEQLAPIEVPMMPIPSKPLSLPPGDSIVFINGEPLIGDKKQSLSMDEDTQVPPIKEKDRNQVNELFNLFFGPPPNSKLVVAQPHIVEPIQGTVKKEQPLNIKDEPSSSPLDQPIKVTLTKFDKLEDGNEKEESPIEPGSLFGHMFSMPQFGGPQAAQIVNQPGRAPAANASRETMQCECHKISTNSSVSSSSNASSPRPPAIGGGSSNSTGSAGASSSPPRPGGSFSGGSSGSSGSSGGSNSSGGFSSPSGSGSSSNSSPQRSNSSSPSGGLGSSSGGSSGSGSSGGSSSGSLGGSSGGGQQQRPAGQSSGNSPVNPIGYVAPPPYGPPPVGYALVYEPPRNQLPVYTAGQQSGNSLPRQVNPGFARPGSMLSALNNSTEFDNIGQFDTTDLQFDEDDEHDDSDDE